jgi:hypothetical protein
MGSFISPVERSILSSVEFVPIEQNNILTLVDRINRTIDYAARGIR